MTFNTFLLVLKAVVIILPWIITKARNGELKDASEDAVLEALVGQFTDRIAAANAAKEGALKDDEANDPNNRTAGGSDDTPARRVSNLSVG